MLSNIRKKTIDGIITLSSVSLSDSCRVYTVQANNNIILEATERVHREDSFHQQLMKTLPWKQLNNAAFRQMLVSL